MRSHELETALRTFVEEAALRLQADLAAGAEVPFELDARSAGRGRGAQLYCYRPLTDVFLRERWRELEGLESYARAARLLEGYEGLERYMLAREAPLGGEGPPRGRRGAGRQWPPRTRAHAALRLVLGDVFADQSDCTLREERLRRALDRLDCLAHPGATEVTLVATLHGLAIASAELPLARGLTLARPDALPGVPDGAVAEPPPTPARAASLAECPPPPAAGDGDAGHLVVAYVTEDADPLAAVAHGREVLGRLLRALRLFGDARLTLGRLAWARVGVGPWGAVALPWGGRPHGRLWVSAAQEDELRAFCSLVSRRAPREGELAWALARYEAGCEQATELRALSDYLMALRALLEPEGPSARALLAGRLAALCATPAERPHLARRMARALALERAAIAGTAVPDTRTTALVREVGDHLGALLRDVICGHLRPDLASLADELLARPDAATAAGAPAETTARSVARAGAEGATAGGGAATAAGGRSGGSGEQHVGHAGEAGEVLHVPV